MNDIDEEFEDSVDDFDSDEEELGEDEEIEDLDDDDLDDDDLDDDLDDDDLDDETRSELKAAEDALSQKEQNARALAIRRALEERAENRRMHDDLDYLDD